MYDVFGSAQLAPSSSLLESDFYFTQPEKNYVKPLLQVLVQFTFKQKHLPGVERMEEMYAELQSSMQHIFLEFLGAHAAEIAELQSRVQASRSTIPRASYLNKSMPWH